MREDNSRHNKHKRRHDHRRHGSHRHGEKERTDSNKRRRNNNNHYQQKDDRNGRRRSADDGNDRHQGGDGYGRGQKKNDRRRNYSKQYYRETRNDHDRQRRHSRGIVTTNDNAMSRASGNQEISSSDKGPVPINGCLEIKKESKDLSKLNKDTWDQDCWTWEDKIRSQMKDLREGKGLQLLEGLQFPIYCCLKEDTEDYFQKKKAAAEAAFTEISKQISQREDVISEDEYFDKDDAMYNNPCSEMVVPNNGSIFKFNYDINLLKLWAKALPYNLLFLVGFEVNGEKVNEDRNCHCPCGHAMKNWRIQFRLEGTTEGPDQCDNPGKVKKSKKFEPSGLMDHVGEHYRKGGNIHGLIELYIRNLYADHNNGCGHKALHNLNDSQQRKAVAEQLKLKNRNHKKIELKFKEQGRALEESKNRESRLQVENKKLEQLNKEKHEKIERLKKDLEFLKISPNDSTKETSSIDLKKYKDIFYAYINLAKGLLLETKDKVKPIKLEVSSSQFSLNDLFASWNKNKDKDETYLFRDLDHKGTRNERGYHNWKIFLKWNVIFRNNIQADKKLAKEITAIDEGGPTREFITQVCKQMGSLSVPVKKSDLKDMKNFEQLKIGTKVCIFASVNGMKERREGIIMKKQMHNGEVIYEIEGDYSKIYHVTKEDVEVVEVYIRLFEKQDGGFVPVTDAKLEIDINSLTNCEKNKRELLVTVKKFYRAIGRIMCHCIVSFDINSKTNYPIASQSLPLFFRNVILRGVRPGDEAYSDGDVINHLNDIDVSNFKSYVGGTYTSFNDDDKEEITAENIFTKLIPMIMLDSRKISIEAMTEGLTLNGMLNIQSILKPFPLDVVSKLIFGIPVTTAEDVIKILIPGYSHNVDHGRLSKNELECIQQQQIFFEKTIPKVLRDMDESEKADEVAYNELVSDRNTFIMSFVKFCTGFDFLPDPVMNPNFKILIKFSFEETRSDNFPIAHSCVNELLLPGDAYQNDIDTFKEKLKFVCQFSNVVGFDMQ